MTVYFFHLRNPDMLLEDCEGTDLPDLHAALLKALRASTELAADPARSLEGLAFEVTDSSGRLLLSVPVSQGAATAVPPPSSRGWTLSTLPHCRTTSTNLLQRAVCSLELQQGVLAVMCTHEGVSALQPTFSLRLQPGGWTSPQDKSRPPRNLGRQMVVLA